MKKNKTKYRYLYAKGQTPQHLHHMVNIAEDWKARNGAYPPVEDLLKAQNASFEKVHNEEIERIKAFEEQKKEEEKKEDGKEDKKSEEEKTLSDINSKEAKKQEEEKNVFQLKTDEEIRKMSISQQMDYFNKQEEAERSGKKLIGAGEKPAEETKEDVKKETTDGEKKEETKETVVMPTGGEKTTEDNTVKEDMSEDEERAIKMKEAGF